MKSRCVLLGVVMAMLGCAGCATGGARLTKDLRALESESVLKRATKELDRRMLGVRTVQFVGTLNGNWMGREGTYQIVGAIRWPIDFRIDLLDPALGVVAALVVNDGELTWYLPQEHRAYRGEATARALGRTTLLAWTPAEVGGLLAGLPPMEYGDRFTDWWIGPEGVAVSPDEQAVLAFDAGHTLPERYIRFREPERRRPTAQIDFSEYRPLKGFMIPHAIRIETLHPKTVLSLQYESVEVNPPLRAGTFALDLPEGTQIVRLK